MTKPAPADDAQAEPKRARKKSKPEGADAAELSASPGAARPEPPEVDAEWQRKFFAERRLGAAQIPRRFMNKTLDNFEKRDVARRHLVEHARHFIGAFDLAAAAPQGLLMTGPVGCGKSHLAVAILRGVIEKGHSGLYYNSPDLLRDIRSTFDESSELTEDELIEHVSEVDLLVLDDLGAEKISDFVLDRFYLIVNKRYEECRPLIVTTNLDEETLRNRLGGRILSRFDEMCPRFGPFPQEDYRRRLMSEA